ncbi:Cupin-8 domain-containing protein [Pyrenophora tritici-repentis]|nr:Cupin-8 domain-containing protein [Pyrenophora tritici-repentis]KAI0589641.1 Cupin-8 domain-containing protein [Pyrenophora tritici-repentis]KAI0625306.1 Cupin-8 domain-containing protein [Pyrenophora tritici-repentis]KAI1593297.1 Cupin-8 domain containing protein [Pyrenophora tritici-repentis]
MNEDSPTLEEIIELTRQELTTAQAPDPIRECGRAALLLLPNDPDVCLKLAYQKLHDVPYKDVKTCWRRLYIDASLYQVLKLAEHACERDEVDQVVRLLDMALILTGAPGREELVELWFTALKAALTTTMQEIDINDSGRPLKRQKLSSSSQSSRIPTGFPIDFPEPAPTLQYPIQRTKELSLSAFQKIVSNTEGHTPLIIEGAIQHWPALEERPWNNPGYLLEQTLGGRRLIPVEVGKSYTDEGWGQRIITFREFMETYMLDGFAEPAEPTEETHATYNSNSDTAPPTPKAQKTPTGYLAQHDLFAQIPSLRADISTPDYCYSEPAHSPHLTHIKPVAKLDEPLLNAWFGPAGTISPLHTDPYHNILAQVAGYKYVRLYAPHETRNLHPRSVGESGVDMSNTSQVDLDEAMAVYPDISCWESKRSDDGREEVLDEARSVFEEQFPGFKDAEYVDAILGPGECLYLPF